MSITTNIHERLDSGNKKYFNKDVENLIEKGIDCKLRLFENGDPLERVKEDGDMKTLYKLASSLGLASPQAESNEWYYGVYIPPEARCSGDMVHVYSDKVEALKVMKQSKKARFKQFRRLQDAADFAQHGAELVATPTPVQMGGGEKPASFKGPKPQDLVQFRKAIEAGDLVAVESFINENPRYLVSSGDTPSILQEGCRYNALHVAARSNRPEIAELILNSVESLSLLSRLYDDTDEANLQARSAVLLDLYLNTPDKTGNETPLHFAAKHGASEVVELLTSYPQCQRRGINKFGATPKDIACSRASDQTKKKAILDLLDERFFLPVLRYEDNSMPARLGEAFSPAKPLEMSKMSPLSPQIKMPGYAGPMSKDQAADFVKKWHTPPSKKKESELRFTDPERGHERFARSLAHDFQVPWREYWPFLDTFVDLSSDEGLELLENYLTRRFDETYQEMVNPSSPADLNDTLSPMTALCQTLQSCTLNDNNNISKESKDDRLRSPPRRIQELNKKRTRDDKKSSRRDRFDIEDILQRKTDNFREGEDQHNFSSMLCVERSCQVFGKRLVNGMLLACSTADVNSMDSGCEHLKEYLEPEVKRLQVLVNGYLHDSRFQSVAFRVVHSRVASVAVSAVRPLLTPSEKNILSSCLRAIAIADGTVSDDEDILFSSRRDDQSSLSIVLKTHLLCLTERLLTELNQPSSGDDAVGSVQSESDCRTVWAQAVCCACDWEPYTHQARARAAWRRHQMLVPRILTFQHEEEPNEQDTWRSCETGEVEKFVTPPGTPEPSSSGGSCENLYESGDETLPLPDTFIYPSDEPTKTDMDVLEAISGCKITPESHPSIYRWRHLVQLNKDFKKTSSPAARHQRPHHLSLTPRIKEKNSCTSPSPHRAQWERVTGAFSPSPRRLQFANSLSLRSPT